jgi:FKBP-type peptidyl-prolyl cis-trans isomerase
MEDILNHQVNKFLLVVFSPLLLFAADPNSQLVLDDYFDSLSYVLGRDIGAQLKDIGTTVKLPAFNEGIRQALQGESAIIDSSTIDNIRRRFADYIKDQMAQKEQEQASTNRAASQKFLENNKKSEGVKTTSSGLQYKVLQKGKGTSPTATDSVVIQYKGSLIDGTVIDSTSKSQPATLDLSKTIPGLTEGIQLMSVGSKYRFFIPPELAYGSMGAPPAIPPESVLIFDIELIDVPGQKANTGTLY